MYQIKQSVLLSYVLMVLFFLSFLRMQSPRDLDFDLKLTFLKKPHIYYSCMQNYINMDQQKLWEIPTFK